MELFSIYNRILGVETVTYLYDIPAISTRGPGILLATDRQAQHGTGAFTILFSLFHHYLSVKDFLS